MAAAESCGEVVLGSLLNLGAVGGGSVRERGVTWSILCAGWKDTFAIDDAYCAGRIVALLGAERSDAAVAAEAIAARYPKAIDGINARTYGPPGLEEDIAWVAREGGSTSCRASPGWWGRRPRFALEARYEAVTLSDLTGERVFV